MEIVERRERDGVWWARDPAGTWYRWNAASDGWDGPLTPPWPLEQPHPDEAAIVSAALAAGARTARALDDRPPEPERPDGSDRQMNRVDAWWNREFPPFSRRRLAFGLVVLPVIAGLQELLFRAIGWRASLPRFVFVCVAGGVLLSMAFLPGMREMAERLQRARGTSPSPWPWRLRRSSEPEPPLPPMERNLRRDFVVALPFSFVIMIVVSLTVAGREATLTPAALLTDVIAAIFTAAVVTLRTTIVGLALFSIAGGLLGGLFMIFLSAMTFSDPGGDFLLGWALGSVLLFVYAYPMWQGIRNLEARGFRLPMWLVMGGTVLLGVGAALVFVAER